jgi:gas vesicle protein
VGAAAALFITPESGEQTRMRLQERSIELKSRFDEVSAGLQERGKVVFDEAALSEASTIGDNDTEAASAPEDQESTEESSA